MCKRQGLRGRVEMLRSQYRLREVLQRIGLRYKTSLDLRGGILDRFLPSSLRVVVIGCQTLSLRREKVLVHQPRSQLVECLGRNTIVIALKGTDNFFVVVKVGTRLGISLM